MNGLSKFMVKRLLAAIPLLIGTTIVVFTLIHSAPGDPTLFFIAENEQDPAVRQRVIKSLGLDQPLYIQYGRWLGGLLQGDLGHSFTFGSTVSEVIGQRLPATLELQTVGLILSVLIAVPLGAVSAVRPYSWADQAATLMALGGLSMPNFWMGLLLMMLFSVQLGWLPSSGSGDGLPLSQRWLFFIMPVLVLSLRGMASFARFTRSSMLEVLQQDYVRTARAKGMPDRVVVYKHALRNALIPVITVIGLSIPVTLGGSVIVESVFAWPGIGLLATEGVLRRDYPVIMGVTILTTVVVILSNLLVDVLYVIVDPRIIYD